MAHLYKKTHLFSDINFERNTKKTKRVETSLFGESFHVIASA